MAEPPAPATRWSRAGSWREEFADRFDRVLAEGGDVDGEARLADLLLPRGARVLDVGAGFGRVTAALRARGHRVVGIEPDADLCARAERVQPGLGLLPLDVLAYEPGAGEGPFDLQVCVGNVLLYLAEDTERTVLARLAGWAAPRGRLLVGVHLRDLPPAARHYPLDELVADAVDAGWELELHAGTYDLRPPSDDYAVLVLTR